MGTVFNKETLQRSGLTVGDELLVDVVAPGEIRLRRAGAALMLPVTADEAREIAGGRPSGEAWDSVIAKARQLVRS